VDNLDQKKIIHLVKREREIERETKSCFIVNSVIKRRARYCAHTRPRLRP